MKYTIREKVWLYPGETPWHFVNVSKKESQAIKERYGKYHRGFGSLPVMVTIGRTSWKTSIFPDTISGTYLLPLKVKVREKEEILADDIIIFSIKVMPGAAKISKNKASVTKRKKKL